MTEDQNIITDPIPPEEEIEKTKLWKRIDYTRSMIEKRSAEIDSILERTVGEMKRSLHDALEELTDETSKAKKQLTDEFRSETDRIIGLHNAMKESISKMFEKQDSHIEAKMKEFNDSAESMVHDLSSDLYSDLAIDFSHLKEDFEQLKSDLNKSITNYQSEITHKFSIVDGKLEKVLVTLKNFFKEL